MKNTRDWIKRGVGWSGEVFHVSKGASCCSLGPANDQIDHFDRR